MPRTMFLAAAALLAAPAAAVPFKAGSAIVKLPNGTTAAADPTLKGVVQVDRLVPFKSGESSRFIFMKTTSTISKPDHARAYLYTTTSMVPDFWIEGQGN